MIRFSHLQLEDVGDGKHWDVLAPLTYMIDPVAIKPWPIITVPGSTKMGERFTTDLASCPRWAWSLGYGPTGKYNRAALIHDLLYAGNILPRWRCDEIMIEASFALGVSLPIRTIMYTAVRVGGYGPYWHKNTCRSIAKVRALMGLYEGSLECVDPKDIKRPLWSDGIYRGR